MPIVKLSLVLNTDDPEQLALYNFAKFLPNGKKRNASGFLRTLLDREYQRNKNKQPQQARPPIIKNQGGLRIELKN